MNGSFAIVQAMWSIASWLGDAKSSILEEIFNDLGNRVGDFWLAIVAFINGLIKNKNLGISWLTVTSYIPILNDLYYIFRLMGAVVVLSSIVYYIIKKMINPNGTRQSFINLGGRVLLCAVLIADDNSFALSPVRAFLSVCDNIKVVLDKLIVNSSDGEYYKSAVSQVISSGEHESTMLFGILVMGLLSCMFLFIIIDIFLGWKVLKAYFKVLFEVIERYIMFFIFIAMFPFAISFYVLEETENISKYFLRSCIGQSALVIMSMSLLTFCEDMMQNFNIREDAFITYIFIIGTMNVICRFDNFLDRIGFNVPNSFGMLGKEALGGIKNITDSIRDGRMVGGSVLKTVGAKNNDFGLYKAGELMSTTGKSIINNGIPTNGSMEESFKKKKESLGIKTSDSNIPNANENALKDYMNNPNNNSYLQNMKNMSQEGLNNTVQSVLGENVSNVHDSVFDSSSKCVSFTAEDENGNERNYVLSSEGSDTAMELQDANGDSLGMYLNTENSLSNEDRASGTWEEMTADSGALGLRDKYSSVALNENVSLANDDDGYTRYYDDNDDLICATRNGKTYEAYDFNAQGYADIEDKIQSVYGREYKFSYGIDKSQWGKFQKGKDGKMFIRAMNRDSGKHQEISISDIATSKYDKDAQHISIGDSVFNVYFSKAHKR